MFRLSLLSSAEDVVDDALALLRSEGTHGKFLFLHLLEPHWEYTPPAELLDRFGSRPKDISRLLEMVDQGRTPTHASEIEEIIRLYDGEIAHADRELGRFFASLESLGLYDSALIVVTADHGEAFLRARLMAARHALRRSPSRSADGQVPGQRSGTRSRLLSA